jgi:metallo-beta-lactamase family protein
MHASISFLGGAGTVTGSKHLLTVDSKKILIDCGLFQGIKEQRRLNWAPLGVDAASIDAVVLTHAHLDHCGYLPLLVKQGFRGPIYCSEPTAALARLILLDSAKIQVEDADHANREGYSKHKPAQPLYDIMDAEKVFPLFKPLTLEEWHEVLGDRIRLNLVNSGHILGSTFVEIEVGGKYFVFSGDLGRREPLTLRPRATLGTADVLVLESTYGDRRHSNEDPSEALAHLIRETIAQSGHVLIPTFAIGRTQDILHLIANLKAKNRIPDVPVYLDSPMGARATEIFERYSTWHGISKDALKRLSESFHYVSNGRESMSICRSKAPSIVVAGSGMLTGGRIKHHLESRLSNKRNTVILTGYQAAGTLGRMLREGAQEAKLFGKYVPVRARITEISSLSAHADQFEILEWLGEFAETPKKIFLVHGEPNATEALRVRITDRFHLTPVTAAMGATYDL